MSEIGIIRGYGEGWVATGYIIKLIKMLNRRFRSNIRYVELPIGDCVEYGCNLTKENVEAMRQCDCIFVGDFQSKANVLNYSVNDIAISLSNDTKYTVISGCKEYSSVNIHLVNYFDGGFLLREGEKTPDGAHEVRVCSMYSAKNIARAVCRVCETRRRRLVFVSDGDNEYCSEMFAKKFDAFAAPLSNFHFMTSKTEDIIRELMHNPAQFDTIFASDTFCEITRGIFKAKMGKNVTVYNKFLRNKPVFALRAHESNSQCGSYVPSLYSYITAFADMLSEVFGMEKEATVLKRAMDETILYNDNFDAENIMEQIHNLINKPLKTKFSKKDTKTRYITN